MKKNAFIFPGQGTQAIGMGADLAHDFPVAKDVFDEVDETLHQNLSRLMFEGDIQELTQTQNAQPAVMAVSMAIFRVLMAEGVQKPEAVAGHSLGEYSALCAAGVLDLSQTAKLLQMRGAAMARACQQSEGGMLALLGATFEQANELVNNCGCYVANDNAPGQIVLSGNLKTLEAVKDQAQKMGIKRIVPLAVSGAFHSPLMKKAADEMTPVLVSTSFNKPQIPVYFNVSAETESNPSLYAKLLAEQITAPVRWRELIQNMKMTSFVECGPGTVLSGLVRRILPQSETQNINTSKSLTSYLKEI